MGARIIQEYSDMSLAQKGDKMHSLGKTNFKILE